ncbi:apicoplast ribosomal protein L2, putative (apicoplast) [Plasmodium gallinaceum]|uniref:Apicoplast ribosomal protein L2, putative n=1 Tax=Plasmodium gallinaceum TaxID=5849 RepID=H7CDX0_PLAGA|nr:apicoplast ribosomal protein L2, putative [Plasmodium gallinaceum]BAL70740.1 large subunit ribosomal protein 2 [Plasmodium gallinaceum]CRG98229.1 apicoplast ribosomal protein L2, putative [Plasmodium gallinaceum]
MILKLKKYNIYKYLKNFGKNNKGYITIKNKGGGKLKYNYKLIDFWYDNYNIKFNYKIILFKKLKNYFRNNYIGCILYLSLMLNHLQKYIILQYNYILNSIYYITNINNIKQGSYLQLKYCKLGTYIYNISINNKGGIFARSAGTFAQILTFYKNFVYIKLPSKQYKYILNTCFCYIGINSNIFYNKYKIKNAGYNIYYNKKSHVRGKAMNVCDHPHGGGKGKTSIGRKYPCSKKGLHSKGYKTKK